MCAYPQIIAAGTILEETGWGLLRLLSLGGRSVSQRGGRGGRGGLTEGAEECGWRYIHHPPTRSPYPLIRSPVRVALSRGMHPEAGASPAPSLHARPASRNPKYPGASCATTCPPRLWLRLAPLCVRHCYAFVVRPSQADCVLQSYLKAQVCL